jgi:hypothetical protein
MKSRTLRALLAFTTATAAVVGFAGPSQAASVDGQTYSYPLVAKAAAGSSGNAAGTVDGTMLDYVIFADDLGEDIESVVMHWHTGTSCDDAGPIELNITSGGAIDLIDERFVLEGSIALGTTDMENVYFNLHNADDLAVLACGELDVGDDPLLGSGNAGTTRAEQSVVDFSGANSDSAFSLNGSDVVLTGGVTLEGTKLAINLDLDGDDLLDGGNRLVTLRNSNSCTVSEGDPYLLDDAARVITTRGSTALPDDPSGFTAAFNNTAVTKIPGVDPAPAFAVLDTVLVLTKAEAETLGSMSIVVHGNQAQTDTTTRPLGPANLNVQELEPVACGLLGAGADSFINGNYYSLDFQPVGASELSGLGYLKNTTAGDAGAIEVQMELDAGTLTGVHKVVLDGDTSCDSLAAPIGIQTIAPDLKVNGTADVDVNSGVLRSFEGPLLNTGAFEGDDATLINDGEFSILVTNEAKTTVLACAQLSPSFGAAPDAPAPPEEFSGTVAEATTIEDIQRASDFRSTPDNKGTDQEILRLYTAFFNREPDAAGVKYWIAVSKGEEGDPANRRVYNTLEIAEFFMPQQEFINAFETVSDAEFVDTVYANVLGRPGDTAGLGYWNDILNGTNLSGLNSALAQAENRGELVYYVALSQELVNRRPYAPIG